MPMITINEFINKHSIRLDAQQTEAVKSDSGALLLLAVPGSGKTTTLVARLGYLIFCRDVAPESLLTLTYSVAACHDMKERFARVFGEEYASRMAFRTINGISQVIINKYYYEKGLTKYKLEEENAPILRKLLDGYQDEAYIKELQRVITFIKNMCLSASEIEKLEIDGKPVKPIYDAYVKYMESSHSMDYDDQLVFARKILSTDSAFCERIRRRYSYISVDEAQDTSFVQHEIIRLLVGNSGNLFMVGDEDQSIYGFRAAYPDALLRFEKIYSNARVLFLETNYRSVPQIVSAADGFIAQNKNRRPKHMKAAKPNGGMISIVSMPHRFNQYAYIAKVASSGEELAVLYRNNDSAVPLIDYLDRNHIKFRCRADDSSKFFISKTVRGMTDILRLALEPDNKDAFLGCYSRFGLYISRKAAERAVERFKCEEFRGYFDALAADREISPQLRKSAKLLADSLCALSGISAAEAVRQIRYDMGFGKYIGDNERLDIISALAAKETNVRSLLSRLDALSGIIRHGGDPSAHLILSTVHSSKGLEYDRVMIIDAIDGILPSDTDLTAEGRNQKEEERRLFYVAATRAKNELFLLQYKDSGLGSFINELCAPRKAPAQPQKDAPQEKSPAKDAKTAQSKKSSTKTAQAAQTKRAPAQQKKAPHPLAPSAAKRKPAAPVHPESIKAGVCIRHKKFGIGTVQAVKGDILSVRFDKYGVKKFAFPICLYTGNIKLA